MMISSSSLSNDCREASPSGSSWLGMRGNLKIFVLSAWWWLALSQSKINLDCTGAHFGTCEMHMEPSMGSPVREKGALCVQNAPFLCHKIQIWSTQFSIFGFQEAPIDTESFNFCDSLSIEKVPSLIGPPFFELS